MRGEGSPRKVDFSDTSSGLAATARGLKFIHCSQQIFVALIKASGWETVDSYFLTQVRWLRLKGRKKKSKDDG